MGGCLKGKVIFIMRGKIKHSCWSGAGVFGVFVLCAKLVGIAKKVLTKKKKQNK